MQWLLIILALILAIPTYGVSIFILILVLPYLGAKTRNEVFPKIIRMSLMSRDSVYMKDVYFSAAEKYAEDTNNIIKQEKGRNVNFLTIVDGEKINVMISRSVTGGIIVIAKNDDELIESIKNKLFS